MFPFFHPQPSSSRGPDRHRSCCLRSRARTTVSTRCQCDESNSDDTSAEMPSQATLVRPPVLAVVRQDDVNSRRRHPDVAVLARVRLRRLAPAACSPAKPRVTVWVGPFPEPFQTKNRDYFLRRGNSGEVRRGRWVFWEGRKCKGCYRKGSMLFSAISPLGGRAKIVGTGRQESAIPFSICSHAHGLARNWRLANVSIRRLARPMGRWCRTGVFAFARCQVPAFSFVEWASLPPPANGLLDAVLRDQPHNHAVMDVVGLGDALHRLTGVTPCNRF